MFRLLDNLFIDPDNESCHVLHFGSVFMFNSFSEIFDLFTPF